MKKILCIFLAIVYAILPGSVAFANEETENAEITEAAEVLEDADTEELTEAETETKTEADELTERGLIKEVYTLSATFYYCDTPTERVVLRAIAPIFDTDGARAVAKEAEYLEIKVSPDGIFMADGTKNSVDGLNAFADSEVWVIIVKKTDGNLEIPYFSFK